MVMKKEVCGRRRNRRNVNLVRNRLLILFFIGVFVLIVTGGSVEGACTETDGGNVLSVGGSTTCSNYIACSPNPNTQYDGCTDSTHIREYRCDTLGFRQNTVYQCLEDKPFCLAVMGAGDKCVQCTSDSQCSSTPNNLGSLYGCSSTYVCTQKWSRLKVNVTVQGTNTKIVGALVRFEQGSSFQEESTGNNGLTAEMTVRVGQNTITIGKPGYNTYSVTTNVPAYTSTQIWTRQLTPSCTNECSPLNAKDCARNGSAVFYGLCGNHDTDSCLEWDSLLDHSCPATELVCFQGACVDGRKVVVNVKNQSGSPINEAKVIYAAAEVGVIDFELNTLITGLTPQSEIKIGTWAFTASKAGYTTKTETLSIPEASGTRNIEIVLQKTTSQTCTDGIQNQGEIGVDCGGPCSACPTCTDNDRDGWNSTSSVIANQALCGQAADCDESNANINPGKSPTWGNCFSGCDADGKRWCKDSTSCQVDQLVPRLEDCTTNPPGPTCGDAVCSTGETCPSDNGSCNDNNACTTDSCSGSCQHTNVAEGTTCPGGTCNANGVCVPTGSGGNICGDGQITGSEMCDGTNLSGKSCSDFLGFSGSGLSCNADCLGFNTTTCTPTSSECSYDQCRDIVLSKHECETKCGPSVSINQNQIDGLGKVNPIKCEWTNNECVFRGTDPRTGELCTVETLSYSCPAGQITTTINYKDSCNPRCDGKGTDDIEGGCTKENVPCPQFVELPFFGEFGFILSVIVIAGIYAFLIFRKRE